ncbi:related to c-module-binding factor [Cephalotrichum gorgonifer]|uniref:Related to c-module-binding factor n=1 Tax=Cephalotrichum gorgonifer TaxID=2041049 RepID=A0AAE8SXY5_9PEZI|nr:related to c-module-binding factor [Cephalotrichum gorgonifer]
MPAPLHPQAKFDPIPPDLDLHALVDETPNLSWVLRISTAQIRNLSQQEFENLVNIHVIQQGRPLVISGWDDVLPKDLFSSAWLIEENDKKQENVRDINAQTDIPMTLGHYMRSMRQLANQWTPTNYRDERRQRLYLKDIDCPPQWHDALRKIIPPNLFYLNENVTDRGVLESDGDRDRNGDIFRNDVQSAPAGDLMSCLPEEMRAQNLMCYIGHEGTYTAAHREMCASLGQNIMVETSGSENGEKPGSSIWFMTETNDREVVREYFLSMLGHDIEIEKHFAQINAWKKATFPVYVVEQKVGDFVLVPPLAAHQVWNRGTRTMKVAWNRTTVETLEMAMKEALPKARLVCRDEQYKNKAIVYYALCKYAAYLESAEENDDTGLLGLDPNLIRTSPRSQQLAAEFRRLFYIFSDILTDEMFATKVKEPEFIPFDSCITCSYCRSNIFNRFLTCKHCVRPLLNGEEDTYDVCMECYAMGRSCLCVSRLQWCEQWNWSGLVDKYEHWRAMIIKNDGFVDMENSPLPLEIARRRRGKKSLAQVCQEGLKRRPFKDITKPEAEKPESEPEPEVDDEGRIKKKKYKRKPKKGETRRCHVCCNRDYAYKVQLCSNPGCVEGYCYGTLYRAFDMMPQAVMESEHWQCPKCLGICNCGGCRRAGNMTPYTPKSTSLGHDTRPIADDRSVEMLVDFRMHNLTWLKAAGEESRSNNSRRMQRLREQADMAKSQEQANQATADEDAHATANGSAMGDVLPQPQPQPTTNGHGPDMDIVDIGTNGHATTNGHAPDDNLHDDGAEAHHGPNPMLPQDHPVAPLEASLHDRESVNSGAYPDPSMNLPQHLIGMGYYEQDDSPDKILFNPYETPTAESMVLDEPDIPEYLKKSIRAAKRKARQANEDDPDFSIRRRNERKKQKKDHAEDVELDPALFSTPESRPAALHHPPTEGAAGGEGDEGGDHPTGDSEEAFTLSLRRAKPKHSYAETDEVESLIDDPEDILPPWSSGRPRADTTPREARPEQRSEGEATPSASKKRGRPAKNLGTSLFSAPASDSPSQQPKRRGRPPKSRLSNVVSAEDGHVETDAPRGEEYGTLDDELRNLARDLEEELTRDEDADAQLADAAADGSTQKRTRGRPRRSAPQYAEVELTDEDEVDSGDERVAKQKRGPGRRRSSAAAFREAELSDEDEADTWTQKRGPGRPRRSIATVDIDDEYRSTPKRGPGRPRRSVPAQDLDEDEDDQTTKKRGPGRPRRSVPAHDSDEDFGSKAHSARAAKRGPGRPTRRSEARAPTSSPPPPPQEQSATKNMKMMSMAERMRLKGKNIKITSRAPGDAAKLGPRSASASASKSASPALGQSIDVQTEETVKVHGRPELRDEGYDPAASGSGPDNAGEESEGSGSDSSADSIPARVELPSLPKRLTATGRTIVSLGDVLSDAEDSSDASSDDEIPARTGSARVVEINDGD